MFNLIEKDLDAAIDDMLLDTYKDKQGQHELMRRAIKDAYAYELVPIGGEANISPDNYDETILEKAFMTVTGGLVETFGKSNEPAYRGQTQEEWDDYLDSMDVRKWKILGDPLGFSYTQLNSEFHDENIAIKNAGENNYYMFHIPSNQFIRDKRTGGPFIFKWVENFADMPPEVDPRKSKVIEQIEKDREEFRLKKERAEGAVKGMLKAYQSAFDKFQEATTFEFKGF
jgi:hypothetical protein